MINKNPLSNILPPMNHSKLNNSGISKKICPWEVEDLRRIYNIERFPERVRREAKKLRKFGLIGNLGIITANKMEQEYRYFKSKKPRDKAINEVSKYIEIPKKTFEVKMSQLNAYIKADEEKKLEIRNKASKELIKTYEDYKYIDYKDILEVFNEHEIYEDYLLVALKRLRWNYLEQNDPYKLSLDNEYIKNTPNHNLF